MLPVRLAMIPVELEMLPPPEIATVALSPLNWATVVLAVAWLMEPESIRLPVLIVVPPE